MPPLLLIITILFFIAAVFICLGFCIKGMNPTVAPVTTRRRSGRTSRRLERSLGREERRPARSRRSRGRSRRAVVSDELLEYAAEQPRRSRRVANVTRRKSRRLRRIA